MPKKTKKASRDALRRFQGGLLTETVTEEEREGLEMQPLQGMPGSLVEALWGSTASSVASRQTDASPQQPGRNGSAAKDGYLSAEEHDTTSSSEDTDEEDEENEDDEEVIETNDHSSLFLQFVDQQRAGSENMDVIEVLVNAVDLKKVCKDILKLVPARPRAFTVFWPALMRSNAGTKIKAQVGVLEKAVEEGMGGRQLKEQI